MLNTCICSLLLEQIGREYPLSVLQRLQTEVNKQNRIVISAITYVEICFGAIGNKASPKHNLLVNEFLKPLDDVLPWGVSAVDATAAIKKELSDAGTPIGNNDTAIASHAIATGSVLVTNKPVNFNG